MNPTLAGFLAFIRSEMGINSTVLPDSTPAIGWAFSVAMAIVNPDLAAAGFNGPAYMPPPSTIGGGAQNISIFTLAVYNLAGDNLINYAPDVPDAPDVPGSDPAAPYFQYLRNKFGITNFVAGVVASTGDQGSSVSLQVPEALKNLTLADLQYLKTPYGRQYLAFAQRYGTLWGLT